MSTQTRSLWQMLLAVAMLQKEKPLTCDECFAILDYLADIVDMTNVDQEMLQKVTRKHINRCPGCRDRYLERLQKWEGVGGGGD